MTVGEEIQQSWLIHITMCFINTLHTLELLISDSTKQWCSNWTVSSLNLWTFLCSTELALKIYVHFEIHNEHVGNCARLPAFEHLASANCRCFWNPQNTLHSSGYDQLYYQVFSNTNITLNSLHQPTVEDETMVEFSSVHKEFSEVPQGY